MDENQHFDRIALQHFKEVGQHPLPTAQEERRLFTTYRATRTSAERARKGGKAAVAAKLEREAAALEGHIACGYLRFVIKEARDRTRDATVLRELMSEGYVGLMVAIKRFDPAYKVRFLTYGAHWIRVYMQEFQNKAPLVHVSNSTRKENRRRKLAEDKLIAQGLLADYTVAEPTITSYDPAMVASGYDLEALIRQHRSNPLQFCHDAGLSRLDTLVLVYYFGLRGGAPMTFGEMAQFVYELDGSCLTNETIRAAKDRALVRLKDHLASRKITGTGDLL